MPVNEILRIPGIILQESPRIYLCVLPGRWLLKRTTPSWRIKDPETGFQRMVKEDRAREIAIAVLDQHRNFPNAIVLATDKPEFAMDRHEITITHGVRFLVVDGQHRLWAQKYSTFDAQYACTIHTGMSDIDMAKLFLEINDNQKRVPSSLRWDLVRLVRPQDDPQAIGATELIYQLASDKQSPLYQRIDLTGEQTEIQLKQASLAPELRILLGKKSPISGISFDAQYDLLVQYFLAIKSMDPDRWGLPDYPIYKARVLRAFIRLLPDLIANIQKEIVSMRYKDFLSFLKKIEPDSLETDAIRALQGNAGIKAIYNIIHNQVLPK